LGVIVGVGAGEAEDEAKGVKKCVVVVGFSGMISDVGTMSDAIGVAGSMDNVVVISIEFDATIEGEGETKSPLVFELRRPPPSREFDRVFLWSSESS
jgi:hypothetical protein